MRKNGRRYGYGLATVIAGILLSQATLGQNNPIKIGFIATFTGPVGGSGTELRNGFDLGIEELGGKLGGRPVQVIYGDDNTKPDIGRQLADKMIESDRVNLLSGMMFTAVTLAAIKPAFDANIPVLSVNTGPAQLAGKGCNPLFYNVVNQNQQTAEAIGLLLNQKDIKTVALIGIDNPAGKELIGGVTPAAGEPPLSLRSWNTVHLVSDGCLAPSDRWPAQLGWGIWLVAAPAKRAGSLRTPTTRIRARSDSLKPCGKVGWPAHRPPARIRREG